MHYVQKAIRTLTALFLVLIRLALLTVLIALIVGLILLGLIQINSALSNWNASNWQESISVILIGCLVLAIVPTMVFQLLDNHIWAKRANEWYRKQMRLVLKMMIAPLIPYAVLAAFAVVITFTWALAISFAGWSSISNTASWYLIGTITLLVFTFFGQGVIQRVLQWGRLEVPWLLHLFRSSLVRFYIYALLAVAYFIFNLENFAAIEVLPWELWKDFRSVMIAWRDYREGTTVKAG